MKTLPLLILLLLPFALMGCSSVSNQGVHPTATVLIGK